MSRITTGFKAIAAAAALSLGMISSANAASKDLSAYGWMADLDPGLDLTILSTSNNGITLSLEKFADFTTPANADGVVAPLSITFRQVASNAVPNISIDNEQVINDSGVTWTGFKFSVTGGTSNNGTLPHFDTTASSSFSTDPFSVQAYSSDSSSLTATGGTLPAGVFPANLFTPGTSGALVIAAAPFSSGNVNQSFNFVEQPLTSTPAIPLPAAAWTSLSGLLGLGLISKAKDLKKILS